MCKIKSEDILISGADIKAYKIPDNEEVRNLIKETNDKQEEILKSKYVSSETLNTIIDI